MTFSKPTTNPNMVAADFEITLVPVVPGDILPGISVVTPDVVDPKITTVTLNKRFQETRWTCFRDKGSNRRCCVGSLPGDADNDGVSQDGDKFEIIDNLNGGVSPVLVIEKCDTDRSVLCTPADLLMVVDLLNGADMFDPTRGNTLPVCPSFLLPP
jgi:hypothetical protein